MFPANFASIRFPRASFTRTMLSPVPIESWHRGPATLAVTAMRAYPARDVATMPARSPALAPHAITVAPYMGEDSVAPFMDGYADRWTIVLALTSNAGADDFEFHGTPPLYERVVERCQTWGSPDELMFVVGATRPEQLRAIRSLAPDHFFLVPGVGAQGGRIEDVMEAGWIEGAGGLLINASRSILYASAGEDYAAAAAAEAQKLQEATAPYFTRTASA